MTYAIALLCFIPLCNYQDNQTKHIYKVLGVWSTSNGWYKTFLVVYSLILVLLNPLDHHGRCLTGVGDHAGKATSQNVVNMKKADKKKKDNTASNKWTHQVTLDSIVLSTNFGSIASIDLKPLDAWNIKYLRALCSKFKISGYENARRDQMVHLLCER